MCPAVHSLLPQLCSSDGARVGHLSSSPSVDENQRGGVQIRAFLPTCLLPTHHSLHLTTGGVYGKPDGQVFENKPSASPHVMLLDVVHLQGMVISIP